MVKYINEEVKTKLRKEAKSQKRPTVLTFEKEINKKKNENKTVEEIMAMVEASKNELKKWVPDEDLRYNKLIAEYQANTWKEIVQELSNPKYNIEVTEKFVKTVRGFVSNDEMIIPFIQEFYTCVDKTKLDWQAFTALQNMASFNYFKEYLKMKQIATNLQKEAQKDIPPFEKFVLNYKGLTIKEVKSIYQEEVEKSEMKFEVPTKVEIVEKEFEKSTMKPFYQKGIIKPINIQRVAYDFIDSIYYADNGKLSNFQLGNENIGCCYIPSYFVLLKRAKLLSVTKIKNTLNYKIYFRLTKKTFITPYFTNTNFNNNLTFETIITERISNGEDYSTVLVEETINYINTLKMFREEIIPELKFIIDTIITFNKGKLPNTIDYSLKNVSDSVYNYSINNKR